MITSAEQQRHRQRWRWTAAAIAAVLLAGSLTGSLVYRHWLHSVRDFDAYAIGGMRGGWPVGQVRYTSLEIDQMRGSRPLRLDAVRPRILTNTAGARINLIVCVRKPGYMDEQDLRHSCRDVHPFHPGERLTPGFSTAQILIGIRAAHPGTVHVAGADVGYHDGKRSATQYTGMDIVARVQ